jgi:D-alanine-D-alanine ligase-like ATP-grasp enzyme
MLILGVVLAVSACATTTLGKEVQALQAVNAALVVANAQFSAGKMSKETHKNVLLWADAAKAGIDAAVKAGDAETIEQITADARIGTIRMESGSIK